jgi:two-component system, NarL family, sensor kinase
VGGWCGTSRRLSRSGRVVERPDRLYLGSAGYHGWVGVGATAPVAHRTARRTACLTSGELTVSTTLNTSRSGSESLLSALGSLGSHDHLCAVYETSEEHLAVAIAFIRLGLERGERCLFIADEGSGPALRDAMTAAGIDVERAIASERLILVPNENPYLKDGVFDPDAMLHFWDVATAQANARGFPALRATGETKWLQGGFEGLQRWREYESRLNRIVAQRNCSVLCQYDRRVSPPELVLDVVRTHPTVIYRATVCRNFYYVPPEELLGGEQAAHELDRLLSSIRDREEVESTRQRAEEELRRSEGLLRLVLDALPVGLVVMDYSGNILLDNPSSRRTWGGSLVSGPARYAASKGWWHSTGKKLEAEEWASVRALRNGEESINQVVDIESYDGARKVIQNSAAPVRDESGRITGAVVVIEDISARLSAERELQDSYDQMRTLTERLMQAQDDERRRIARMLHETTAQDLAALKMLLARLNRTSEGLSEGDRQLLTETLSLADLSMTEVRTLSYLLHPPFLDETGLLSALRWYAAGFSTRSRIDVTLELPESFERPSPEIETALFRVVQESLINIHRHSGSETARIELYSDAEKVALEIHDRGGGISSATLGQIRSGGGTVGVGIAGMTARIRQLGGHIHVTSDSAGTTVRAELPRAKAEG